MAARAQTLVRSAGAAPSRTVTRLFPPREAPSLDELAGICSRRATRDEYPLAASIRDNVPVYQLPPLSSLDAARRAALQDEWYRVLLAGPGAFVTKGLFGDASVLDRATAVLRAVVDHERRAAAGTAGAGAPRGDHFAAAGRNDRVWNSLGKHALRDPASFVDYYANPWLALACAAWLGPGYRVTAQANNVRPGSAAQAPHRDYHLGFQAGGDACARVPRAMHAASQLLTLQGAVAHVDVPPESGPTRLLPYSQAFEPGFLACRRPEFVDYFLANYVALPMDKGDGLFFNPALFHAAGENVSTDINRMANLLQVSSAFGKPMEAVETLPLLESCWDHIVAKFGREGMSDEVEALLAAITSPYPFPTNMDNNPPRPGGLTPVGELDIAIKALTEDWTKDRMVEEFRQLKARSSP